MKHCFHAIEPQKTINPHKLVPAIIAWTRTNFAMTKRLVAFLLIHNSFTLVLVCDLITAASNKEICIRKRFLGLFKRTGMTKVKEIVDTISINTNRFIVFANFRVILFIHDHCTCCC
uniref:Transmembrane protein n=1 Tax=Medicago truncatula TaxID=3880 RepID=I3T965_MEDTR|nr:unknown [Medicago truncatula]